jgi:6-phosphogluconate dehydrogenase
MQLGMVGLGRMGGNMTERCMRGGHEMVVYDRNPQTVAGYVGKGPWVLRQCRPGQ